MARWHRTALKTWETGFSRRPDLEIVSPGSRRTDYILKHGEYADAGIGHYWIVDITEPGSLVACHLAGELGYQNAPDVTGSSPPTNRSICGSRWTSYSLEARSFGESLPRVQPFRQQSADTRSPTQVNGDLI
jgi:hypothetical protein